MLQIIMFVLIPIAIFIAGVLVGVAITNADKED